MTAKQADITPDDYLLPNGCLLEKGGRVRIPAGDLWKIPEEDIISYGIMVDDAAASSGSEVVYRE